MRRFFVVAVIVVFIAGPVVSDEIVWDGSVLLQLAVSDLDEAISFYTEILGWELISRDDGLRWAKIRAMDGDVTIGVGESPTIEGSGTLSMNFGVEDIDEARALLESKGIVFSGETITIPGVVRLADFRDPDGNRIRLAEDLAD